MDAADMEVRQCVEMDRSRVEKDHAGCSYFDPDRLIHSRKIPPRGKRSDIVDM